MTIKDKITAYLQADHRQSIFVEELGETIFYNPITVLEMEKILVLSQAGSGGQSKDYHLSVVIEKAEEEGGAKIFSLTDRPMLERLPWRVVTRISNAIQGGYSVRDARNDLKKTPSDAPSSPSASESGVF